MRRVRLNSYRQLQFLARVLPAVHNVGRVHFRRLRAADREDALASAVAIALISFARLLARGKDPLRFPTRLAEFAVLQVKCGRQPGVRWSRRDVLSVTAQRARRFRVVSLDQEAACAEPAWRLALVEDRRTTPADTAAARLDIAAWFAQLDRRSRAIAKALAKGHRPGEVARRFRLSPTRISQLREEFRRSWDNFQGRSGCNATAACPPSCR